MTKTEATEILNFRPLLFGDRTLIAAHEHLQAIDQASLAISNCEYDADEHDCCPACEGIGLCTAGDDCAGMCTTCGGSGIDCQCVFGLPRAAVQEVLGGQEEIIIV